MEDLINLYEICMTHLYNKNEVMLEAQERRR